MSTNVCIQSHRGDSLTLQSGNVCATAWMDRRVVMAMSTGCDPLAVGSVQRREKDGSCVPVRCPESIILYNLVRTTAGRLAVTCRVLPSNARVVCVSPHHTHKHTHTHTHTREAHVTHYSRSFRGVSRRLVGVPTLQVLQDDQTRLERGGRGRRDRRGGMREGEMCYLNIETKW